ncbi:long-chain-fatty-acid--CoA ligase [Marilutibacter aestuarii]|uniref:AMP-binding protein n=1 Tax=Marilutibacter aestuarii TaxID=1706195 RepID=A0A507ZWA8_9GAMM|nr:long-chain-fatty-acid--CoA ligase [Lysobacter aestuarii]TQD41217.1 AMP-binding protein [Lysobacter aestuarii]
MHKNMRHWPPGVPLRMAIPETSLYFNLDVAATRYPGRTAIAYYGSEVSYAALRQEVDRLAGFLQARFGVAKGDRVVLYLQNSPQFVVAYHAILRAGAVVVPVNTMNLAAEVEHIVTDCGARVAIFGQELAAHVTPLLGSALVHGLSACYRDYLHADTDLPVPEVVAQDRLAIDGATPWHEAVAAGIAPMPVEVGPDDLAIIPYTSGTTGAPKGCMHTHRSVMHPAIGAAEFCRIAKDQVALAALPMFHVTGLQMGVNAVVFAGGTMAIMTRWDRRCAAMLIQRYRVSTWTAIPTMLFDFLAQPDLADFDLSSLSLLSGGGAAMPKAVAEKIHALWGLPYVEGYGLSETMATTHTNPVQRPKAQCLGIPIQDTDSVVVDPDTLALLPPDGVGEILIRGPQVFKGYWGREDATRAAFVEIEGERFFRTGDLGYIDEDGYFFIVDRLKRMINASGYKVWPAEVENLMFAHPAIQEACVIGIRDRQRGESVKLVAVLAQGQTTTEAEVIAWAREHMAAYKVPHVVEFVDRLPKSGTGKVQWRELQAREREREAD